MSADTTAAAASRDRDRSMMPTGSSVSSVQQGSEEGEAQATTTEAIQIWDRLIGSHLGQRALRVVLASNADDAAVLFRLRLVARRFYSELPKYVARLNFSGLSIPTLPDEIFKPFTNLSLVDLSGCRLAGRPQRGAARHLSIHLLGITKLSRDWWKQVTFNRSRI